MLTPSSLLPLLVTLTLGGCAATQTSAQRMTHGKASPIVDARTTRSMTLATLGARLSDAKVVYVAESHGEPAFHRVQLAVLQLLEDHGKQVAIGIEWLPRTRQAELDAWLESDDDIAVFATAVDWETSWGHSLAAYAPIFTWAQRAQVPMVALNAPPGLSRAVARRGVEDLTDTERAEVTPLDTGSVAHRSYFDGLMKAAGEAHGHTDGMSEDLLARLYWAQLVWDEAMRDGVVGTLDDPANRDRTVVVFAGIGHIDFGLGIPERVRAKRDVPYLIVRPVRAEDYNDIVSTSADAPYPKRRADILWRLPASAPADPSAK